MTQPKKYLRQRELEGNFGVLNVQEEIDGLEEQAAEQGIGGKTLAKLPGLSVVLVRLNAGHELDEHAVSGPAMVQVVQGEVTLHADGQEGRVAEGSCVVLEPNLPHDVRATKDAVLLLTFNEKG